ncbi:uncharacterized protein [Primulina huaijiensis]|uniref:uncharacterized protein n=1 Tax=Primulina huaijiensis TaxID=1492673 RepID=UPI003CC78E70
MAGRPPINNCNPRRANQDDEENLPPPPPGVNLSQGDMMPIATIVAATLQGILNPNANNAIQQPPEPQPRGIKYHYESLRRNRVPTYDGIPDPKVGHNWLKNVESQLHLLEVPEELKIFRRAFLKQYYPAEFCLQKLSEFESFKQTSDMTVIEYTSKFNDLGTYVPTIMADETLKIHLFKKRLNSRIQSALALFKPTNFADLMRAAMSAETDIKRREEEGKHKHIFSGQSSQGGQNFKRPNHNQEKRVKTNAENHKPKENKPNARVFAITQEEADNANNVVAGTIMINKMPTYVLFDCGASHSFVSKRFAKKLKLEGETLSETLRIATSASKTIETYKGMDWLAKNHALVDFQKKSVKLQTPNHENIIYHGRSKEQKPLLSASQT